MTDVEGSDMKALLLAHHTCCLWQLVQLVPPL